MVISQRVGRIKLFVAFIHISGLCYFIHYALTPQEIKFIFDPIISKDIQEKITATIVQKDMHKLNSALVLEKIKTDLPAVQSISILYKGSRTAYITVKVDKPYLNIVALDKQQNYVLTQNGTIAYPTNFNLSISDDQGTIYVNSIDFTDPIMAKEFVQCMKALDLKLLNTYDLGWSSKNEILLCSRIDNNFVIVADNKTVGMSDRIEYAERIYKLKQNVLEKGPKSGVAKGVTGTKVDIRFKDYVVAAPLGEVNNEKSCKSR